MHDSARMNRTDSRAEISPVCRRKRKSQPGPDGKRVLKRVARDERQDDRRGIRFGQEV